MEEISEKLFKLKDYIYSKDDIKKEHIEKLIELESKYNKLHLKNVKNKNYKPDPRRDYGVYCGLGMNGSNKSDNDSKIDVDKSNKWGNIDSETDTGRFNLSYDNDDSLNIDISEDSIKSDDNDASLHIDISSDSIENNDSIKIDKEYKKKSNKDKIETSGILNKYKIYEKKPYELIFNDKDYYEYISDINSGSFGSVKKYKYGDKYYAIKLILLNTNTPKSLSEHLKTW